ncbi:hypothetical protein CJ204_07820 [Corynebacterium xerosis]|uniref:Uncharacterized protein n=1 Tax=Corynebacterium xerosis TaxID=1725 RepID=A0A2N6SYF6_9CORY|nr:hypothetical protein CJ204_07820 [Corynebacterium xerosis]
MHVTRGIALWATGGESEGDRSVLMVNDVVGASGLFYGEGMTLPSKKSRVLPPSPEIATNSAPIDAEVV